MIDITKNGSKWEARFKYNPNDLALVKQARWRWEPNGKFWWTDDPQKHHALKELIDPPVESGDLQHKDVKIIDIPYPDGVKARKYQLAGTSFMLTRPKILMADDMGCLSGDSIVTINRGGGSRRFTLKQVYERFQKSWSSNIPTFVRSFNGDRFCLSKLSKAHFNGVKKVLKITLKNGETIKCTPDHHVMSSGKWIESSLLTVGQTITCNGKATCERCGSNDDIITYKHSKFVGYCKTCMYRHKRSNKKTDSNRYLNPKDGYIYVNGGLLYHPNKPKSYGIAEHRLVVEASMNGMPLNEWLKVLESGSGVKSFTFLDTSLDVHHKNGNKTDNRLSNLSVVSRSHHHKIHKKHTNIPIFNPHEVEISTIEEIGFEEVYDLTVENTHCYVANNMVVHNCGKTFQTIGVFNVKRPKSTLVICPASLCVNWAREFEKFGVDVPEIQIVKTTNEPIRKDGIVIINYEKVVKQHKNLTALHWDLMICDESHRLKNPKAAITKHVYGKWARKEEDRIDPIKNKNMILLSGTPMLSRPAELWTTVKEIDPAGLGSNWKEFVTRYCNAYQGRWGWVTDGHSNVKELSQKMARFTIRRLKDDVLTELPDATHQVIPLEPTVEQEALIFEEQESLNITDLDIDNPSISMHLNVIAKIRQELAISKLPSVFDLIDQHLDSGKKVVVAAHHRSVVEAINQKYPDESVFLYGGMSPAAKQHSVDSFQNDEKTRIFVGSIAAAGVGITLTAASDMIFAENVWTPGEMQQMADRIRRIGQKNACNYQYPVITGSLDEMLLKKWLAKKTVIESIIK